MAANGNYTLWAVDDLKAELIKRGLPPNGTKRDLVGRLLRGGSTPAHPSSHREQPSRTQRMTVGASAHSGSPVRTRPRVDAMPGARLGSPGGLTASPRKRQLSSLRPVLAGRPTIQSTGGVPDSQAAGLPEADALPGSSAVGLHPQSGEASSSLPPQRASALRTHLSDSARVRLPANGASGSLLPNGNKQRVGENPQKRRRGPEGLRTIDLEPIEVDHSAGSVEALVASGSIGGPSSPARLRVLPRRPIGSEKLPPPPASLGLRARQLRMLLGGGVCQELQQKYSDLLTSFQAEASKALQHASADHEHGSQARSVDERQVGEMDGVEEVAIDGVAAAAAARRARKALVEAVRRSSTSDAWLRRLKRKEALLLEAITHNDTTIAASVLELEKVSKQSRHLRAQYEAESQELQETYEAEILTLQQAEVLTLQAEISDLDSVIASRKADADDGSPASALVAMPSCLAGWCNGGASSCCLAEREDAARDNDIERSDP